jgi:hypothetical protein
MPRSGKQSDAPANELRSSVGNAEGVTHLILRRPARSQSRPPCRCAAGHPLAKNNPPASSRINFSGARSHTSTGASRWQVQTMGTEHTFLVGGVAAGTGNRPVVRIWRIVYRSS